MDSQKSFGLDRLGDWVAGKRTKWVTLFVWILLVVLANGLLPQASQYEDNGADNLVHNQPSVQAEAIIEEHFPGAEGLPALIVWHRPEGLQPPDYKQLQATIAAITERPLPYQIMVPPLHQLPLEALQAETSGGGTTYIHPILFDETADAEQLKESLDALKVVAGAQGDLNPFETAIDEAGALSARITGPAGIAVDATELFSSADVSLLLATVIIVLVILLAIYRSPILALVPLVGVGFAYGLISPILGWFGEQGWATFDSQGISIMTVLLFGAGTDYCLFLISRYREELKLRSGKLEAMRASVAGTSGAIAMSGFTTMFALLALLLAKYGAVDRFAIPFSLAILIMGISTLTLVPALLAILGRASFYPFVPRTPEMIQERAQKKGKPVPKSRVRVGFGDRMGEIVVRKPWWIASLSFGVLLILALFATQIRFTYDTLASFPEDMDSREGFALMEQSVGPGQLAPVRIIVDTEGKSLDLRGALADLPYVERVSDPVAGQTNSDMLAYDAEFSINPYSGEAMDRLPDLRDAVIDAAEQAGITKPGDKVWLSGQTAEQYDTRETTNRDAQIIIPVVIGLIAVLLLAYLRSIVAMVYLILTVILSYFSALGLGWLIIHYGLGAEAIQGFIPLYSFVFLVALGEDYNIFMVSSIWKKAKSMPLKQAIQEGTSQTGGVITSAGLILAATFAVLASLPIQILVHFGLITAIGVLLDTFVVRPFLVPALTALLGKRAFWPAKAPEPALERAGAEAGK